MVALSPLCSPFFDTASAIELHRATQVLMIKVMTRRIAWVVLAAAIGCTGGANNGTANSGAATSGVTNNGNATNGGANCDDTERFTKAAAFLESKFDAMQATTASGKHCYALIDGFVRHRDQTLGIAVAKDVRNFEAYFDFATIVLDVYKTSVGDRFDTLAKKYQAWKTGPYAAAIDACQACVQAGRSDDEPLRDYTSCLVP